MSQDPISSLTYTTEASGSRQQSHQEALVEDPEVERALAAIEENVIEQEKGRTDEGVHPTGPQPFIPLASGGL